MKKIILPLISSILLTTLIACNKQTKDNEYIDDQGNKYKYQLELTGAMPNSEKETTFVILTNNKYLTFEKVSQSLYSSHSSDSLDFHLVTEE